MSDGHGLTYERCFCCINASCPVSEQCDMDSDYGKELHPRDDEEETVQQLIGEPLREDGPMLGDHFDPLPPGAFGAPIVPEQRKQPYRSHETSLFSAHDPKPHEGNGGHAVHWCSSNLVLLMTEQEERRLHTQTRTWS